RRNLLEDRLLALLLIERAQQVARQVFFRREHAQSLTRPLFDFSRIRPEKRWRRRHHQAFDDGEIERDVMPFDAPAPRAFRRRRAEDREVIKLRVARRTTSLLHLTQHYV